MDYNCRSYSYNTWFSFWEDFNYFITKDFNRLGQNYLKKLRSQLKETYRPSTDAEFERLLAIFKGLPIEALPIEALLIRKALLIKAPPVDTNTYEPPKTDSFTFEALLIEACLIEALPMDTDTNEVEIDEHNEPAILFANVIEPLIGTSTVDYCFTGSSIPKSLLTTTLTLPLPSIPATRFGSFHTL
jgi:hypothetical protein